MTKEREKKRKEKINQKTAEISLSFQTNWGLKKLYSTLDDAVVAKVKYELECIQQLDLTQDLLSVKALVTDVKSTLEIVPVADSGDFCDSLVALALGIGRTDNLENVKAKNEWADKMKKKILYLHYPNDIRNQVVNYLKIMNYNISTFLGKPVVKFSKLYVVIDKD